jgi:hypothetical protein
MSSLTLICHDWGFLASGIHERSTIAVSSVYSDSSDEPLKSKIVYFFPMMFSTPVTVFSW